MTAPLPRILTLGASMVVAVGLVAGAVDRSPQLLLESVAAVFAVGVGWVVVHHDPVSPVGPAVAWSVAAIVLTNLSGLLGPVPWDAALWPLNLAGVLTLLLVFPDGPAPGRLWRAVAWVYALATLGLQVALWGARESGGRLTGTQPAAWRLDVGRLGLALLAAAIVLAVVSLGLRYHRGSGRRRQQIRWLMLTGMVVLVLLVGGWVAEARGATIEQAYAPFIVAIVVLVPAAVGVAVVRFDLLDVDRLLSTTATWLVAVGISAGLFALVVFLAGQALSQAGTSSAVAAFVAALVLLPLHRYTAAWVGRFVDRDRFVALATVESFATDVRAGRRQPEEIESVLRTVQDDPELVVQVRTPSGPWATLDGSPVSDPVGVALDAGGEVVAMIRLGSDSHRARGRLADVAKSAWIPIEVSRLRLGLREALTRAQTSRERLAVATADERRRLERDLHDRAQQRIVASAISLKLLQERLPAQQAEEVEGTVRELKETIDELRRIAHGVRPTQLDDGLGPALATLTQSCPIPLELDVEPLPDVSDARTLTAYLVVNEAIVNVLKHAHASHVGIRISARGDKLVVQVSDDGIGGIPSEEPLLALRDRVLSVGGTLDVRSDPGAGTTIAAVI